MRRGIDDMNSMATATDAGMLIGLAQIGAAIGRDPQTAARYIRELGLPARQLPDGIWICAIHNLHRWADGQEEAVRQDDLRAFIRATIREALADLPGFGPRAV